MADITQQFEQFSAMLGNIAVVLAEYRKSLIDQGIDGQLADKMTLEMQSLIINQGKGNMGKPSDGEEA